ncbi:hypothetical protein BMS3Bbin02_01491 [bacterium BMS3Bbin02]|nr:hypothetical protein BMS3Bbin02_01491 [bacterium BMS3Bbin02]
MGLVLEAKPVDFRGGFDAKGICLVFDSTALVDTALSNELFFPLGQFNLIRQFILSDRPFLFHRLGATLEGGLVG